MENVRVGLGSGAEAGGRLVGVGMWKGDGGRRFGGVERSEDGVD